MLHDINSSITLLLHDTSSQLRNRSPAVRAPSGVGPLCPLFVPHATVHLPPRRGAIEVEGWGAGIVVEGL